MRNWLFFGLLFCSFPPVVFAQTSQPAPIDPAATQKANVALLLKTIDRQQREIDQLNGQLAKLEAQLRGLGVEPNITATSKPSYHPATHFSTDSKPKRIVFLRLNGSDFARQEVIRAVNELDEAQFFNVISDDQQKAATSFVPQFAPATEIYKKKLAKDLSRGEASWGHLFDALELASKGPPDLIWIVGWLGSPNEDAFIRDVKRHLKSQNIRINTSIAFAKGHDAKDLHLMWRVARETGGVCLDENGEPIDEPTLAPPPKPEPEPKSILKSK